MATYGAATLLRAPRMCAKSGVWLEGWSKREAQMLLVVMPWAVFVVSAVLHSALLLLDILVPSAAAFVQAVKSGMNLFVSVILAAYLASALAEGFCRHLARCCCRAHGPQRTREGWLALLPVAVCAAFSYGYAHAWHSDTTGRRYDQLFVHGDWPFRLAATGEFAVQVAWVLAADALRFDGRDKLVAAKRWACGALSVLWLLTFVGPKEPGDGGQTALAAGYCARALLSVYAWVCVCRQCAGYLGCVCAWCTWAERPDWSAPDGAPCTPGPERLRQLTFHMLSRPGFLLLVHLPLGYPLQPGAGFASLLRCGFALLLAVALRPAPRDTMEVCDLEREAREGFDVTAALRLCDLAYETYVGPPPPASVVVTGCQQHEWLNGEYFEDGRDGQGYAIYSMALVAGAASLPASRVAPQATSNESPVPKAYLRRTLKEEWVLSSGLGELDSERWAFVKDAASAPFKIGAAWSEVIRDRAVPNRRLSVVVGAGSAVRRFEHHGRCRETDAQWLLVEEEGSVPGEPSPSSEWPSAPGSWRAGPQPKARPGPGEAKPGARGGRDEVSIVIAFRGAVGVVHFLSDANFFLQSLADNANTGRERPAAEAFDLGLQVGAEVRQRARASPSEAVELFAPLAPESPVGFRPAKARSGAWRAERLCAALCRMAGACLCVACCRLRLAGDDEDFSDETYRRAKVHLGFFRVYASVRAEVMGLLRERLDACAKEGRRARVYLCGHSLGGAVACLCALDLASVGALPPVVYTFGAPRLGNAAFRSVYNVLVPATFRVVGTRDIVPTLPPSIRYRQLGREVWLDDAGGVTFAMSWAMRRILPPRDRVQHHALTRYFDLLRKAFQHAGGRELPPIFSFERMQRAV